MPPKCSSSAHNYFKEPGHPCFSVMLVEDLGLFCHAWILSLSPFLVCFFIRLILPRMPFSFYLSTSSFEEVSVIFICKRNLTQKYEFLKLLRIKNVDMELYVEICLPVNPSPVLCCQLVSTMSFRSISCLISERQHGPLAHGKFITVFR